MADSVENSHQPEKRQQFGNRLLTDPKNVFEHNAWDNVVWDDEQERQARSKTEEQLANCATGEDIDRYESGASQYWNKFYGIHENKFFKDRHWLFTEFPELAPESYLPPDKLSALSLSVNNKNVPGRTLDSTVQSSEFVADGAQVLSECAVSDLSELSDKVPQGNASEVVLKDNSSAVSEYSTEDGEGSVVVSDNDGAVSGTTTEINNVVSDQKFPGETAKYRIFEVGCGVGNTVFPILQANNDPDLMVYCCDYSSTAIDLVKENVDYNQQRCHAFVCDISDPESAVPFPEGSLDIIILIFILSANNPDRFQAIINRLASFLRPGGTILFRDYGRYDLAQLRFKKGKCLRENFYVRGDGTRVYFFTQDEMREMMTTAGLVEKQNLVDRRLQVNRENS